MIKELASAPAPWYKAKLKSELLGLRTGTQVWFKLNTERPLSSGPTYWVFDPKNKAVRHLAEDIGDDTLQGIRSGSGWQIATQEQAVILNRLFRPLVNALINSPAWSKVGQPNRTGRDFKIDYSRKPNSEN